jgi:N-acetylglutamate synthase-like GNAT family acetyltransferase
MITSVPFIFSSLPPNQQTMTKNLNDFSSKVTQKILKLKTNTNTPHPSSCRIKKVNRFLPCLAKQNKKSLISHIYFFLIAKKSCSKKEGLKSKKIKLNPSSCLPAKSKKASFSLLFKKAREKRELFSINFYCQLGAPSFPHEFKKFTDEQISYLTTEAYLTACQQRNLQNPLERMRFVATLKKSLLPLKTVALPAFFNRNLVINKPLASDALTIMKKFYADNYTLNADETVPALIKNRGYLSKENSVHQMLILHSKKSQKIKGAIHYRIDYEAKKALACYVYSLKVTTDKRRQGYGSLLLTYVIQDAKEKGCSAVRLKSSEGAFFYYVNLGFIVDTEEVESYEQWNDSSNEEKLDLACMQDYQLILELKEPHVQNILDERLEQILEKN